MKQDKILLILFLFCNIQIFAMKRPLKHISKSTSTTGLNRMDDTMTFEQLVRKEIEILRNGPHSCLDKCCLFFFRNCPIGEDDADAAYFRLEAVRRVKWEIEKQIEQAGRNITQNKSRKCILEEEEEEKIK